jgi:hypothetical protein
MRALIVFESMFGNTHEVADRIAQGMRPALEVEVVPADWVPALAPGSVDLLVVGAPTHVHGLPRVATRNSAQAMVVDHPELHLDVAAAGPGVRDWLAGLADVSGVAAAAFDTRMDMSRLLSGSAARSIARRLRHHGFRLVGDPTSFLVDHENHLSEGESSRAEAWGGWLALQVAGAVSGAR